MPEAPQAPPRAHLPAQQLYLSARYCTGCDSSTVPPRGTSGESCTCTTFSRGMATPPQLMTLLQAHLPAMTMPSTGWSYTSVPGTPARTGVQTAPTPSERSTSAARFSSAIEGPARWQDLGASTAQHTARTAAGQV
jgi:hypothetical protein